MFFNNKVNHNSIKKIKVVYITGSSHSGTTLIELLLGGTNNCFSVGELRIWDLFVNIDKKKYKFKRLEINDYEHCTCGEKIKECPFWEKITNNFKEKFYTNHYEDASEIRSLRNFFLNPFSKISDIKIRNSDYLKLVHKIYEQNKRENPDFKYLIDSSKYCNKLVDYIRDNSVDLKVIHVIRDGRAQLNSLQKMNRRNNFIPENLHWIKYNLLIKKILKRSNSDYIKLSYDLFAQNPDKYIKKIENWLNIDMADYVNNVNNTTYHNVGGNLIRFKKFKSIKYDKKWTKELSLYERWISSVICYLPNKQWVYNKKNDF